MPAKRPNRSSSTWVPSWRPTGASPSEDEGTQRYGDGFAVHATREEAWAAANNGYWDGHRFDPAAFAARVVAGIEAVVDRHPEGRVAVFCHGGTISAYVQHVLQTPAPLFCSADYGSITRVNAGPGAYREMLSFNEQSHLLHA